MRHFIKLLIISVLFTPLCIAESLEDFIFQIRGESIDKQVVLMEEIKGELCGKDSLCKFNAEMTFLSSIYPKYLKKAGIDPIVAKKLMKRRDMRNSRCLDMEECSDERIRKQCQKMDKTTFMPYPFCIAMLYTSN
ncbi:hypothetical protein [Halobacteriovorax sp.]|uniref:hypothetical protein n=1 Tax=Halobacteriovorax sp. TaxID=2020862 RepID=UPI003AF25B68